MPYAQGESRPDDMDAWFAWFEGRKAYIMSNGDRDKIPNPYDKRVQGKMWVAWHKGWMSGYEASHSDLPDWKLKSEPRGIILHHVDAAYQFYLMGADNEAREQVGEALRLISKMPPADIKAFFDAYPDYEDKLIVMLTSHFEIGESRQTFPSWKDFEDTVIVCIGDIREAIKIGDYEGLGVTMEMLSDECVFIEPSLPPQAAAQLCVYVLDQLQPEVSQEDMVASQVMNHYLEEISGAKSLFESLSL